MTSLQGKRVGYATALLLAAMAAQAQPVYRIVGPDGRVTFSDKPPAAAAPSDSAKAGARPSGVRAADADLPFELRQSMARFPVTLYAGSGCVPCNAGRLLLQGRGVPYTEYTVASNADIEALQRISGDNSLPFLTIGGQKIKGFSQAEWTQFLNAAAYPAQSRLPSGFTFAAARPLVTAQAVEPQAPQVPAAPDTPATATATTPTPAVATPAADNSSNPAGIKF